jgi:CheY-like chemotaxis protein/tRNA A-37 threonylcarbamoyl transferase component Bud32
MAKILMVDDDQVLTKYTRVWLTGENHSVEVAHAGMMAWQLLQSDQFDLVVLDWDLPDIKGIEILKKLRAAGASMPVIMLTGRTSIDYKEAGLDAGADDYLTKPFNVKELSARIRANLRKSAPQQPQLKPLGENNEEILKRGNLIGTSLAARYEFIDILGQGGIGIVYKARHPMLNKLIAIKMLQPHELETDSFQRFEIEAQAASRLDHPSIATIHDFGLTEKKQPFLVMEFIEGRALDKILLEDELPPPPFVINTFIQVSDALVHAHASGVLHRDVKPSNIMIKQIPGRDKLPKILDFGCAKLRDLQNNKSVALTQAGQIMGSPPYMSPEQARGRPQDERSDVYSLGCVLYEAVTGMPPHLSDNIMDILFMHVENDATPVREARPDLNIPAPLETIIMKALSRDPAQRHQSMRELRDELISFRQMMQVRTSQ